MPSCSSSSSSSAGWSSSFSSSSLCLGLLAVASMMQQSHSLVQAKFVCDTSLGTYYPYCVNSPDGTTAGDNLPVILFLSGSGARGSPSNVKSLSGYDGIGKLINQYLSGNKGEAQTLAATKFITIIPISPQYDGSQEVRHWQPDGLDRVLAKVSSEYPVDSDRVHVTGFSMGSRGCWRYATARTSKLASLAPSAGGAEASGDGTLTQQKADPTFPLLKNLAQVKLPVWQFAGQNDNTAGTASPKRTQDELVKLGDGNARLSILSGLDHSAMSIQPFNADLLNWMLKQKRSSGSSGSSEDGTGDDAEDTTSSIASSVASVTSKPSSSIVVSSSASSTSTSSTPILLANDPSDESASSTSIDVADPDSTTKVRCKQKRSVRRLSGRAFTDDEVDAGHVVKRTSIGLDDLLAVRRAHQKRMTLHARR